jgi:hypothetical protein
MSRPSVPTEYITSAYTPEQMLKSYGITTVFCIAIALLLWVLNVSDLRYGLTISFCIGYAICSAFAFCHGWLNRRFSPYLTPIPLQVGGLAAGLMLAGLLLEGSPLFFFSRDHSAVVLGVFFGVIVYVFSGTRARLAEYRQALTELQRVEAEQGRQLADTELKLLQAQIEPHFLFNTLSNATSLIHSDPAAAETMLVHLTRLLRRSLKRTRAETASLAEEQEVLEAWLGIASIRMGERLRYQIDIPAELGPTPLPPLLLQPLVENAIEHGLDPRAAGGALTVTAQQRDRSLVLTVEDDGVGLTAAPANTARPQDPNRGTGLRNIRERLAARYGERAGLTIQARDSGGTRAILTLPIEVAPAP